MRVPDAIRHAAADLMAEYGLLIDEDRLEDWVELFAEACDYKVVTRENVEQGLPNILIWCDNKDMLRDRIASYRDVNEYNLHWDRHVIGPLRFCGEAGGVWAIEAAYSLPVRTPTVPRNRSGRHQLAAPTIVHHLTTENYEQCNGKYKGGQGIYLHRDTPLRSAPDEDRESHQGSRIERADDEVIEGQREPK